MAAELYDEAWDEFLDLYRSVCIQRDAFETLLETFIEKATRGDEAAAKRYKEELSNLYLSLELRS